MSIVGLLRKSHPLGGFFDGHIILILQEDDQIAPRDL